MRPRALTWIVLAIAAGAAARRWLDVVEVRGRSMAPTLLPGDRLVVARLHRTPRVGEVVLAPDPGRPRRELVKRVAIVEPGAVALRGDNVAASTDARVAPDRVRWRAVLRYWPPGRATSRLGRPRALEPVDEGGEAACTFPDALVAGPGVPS
jgi:signal peptidase I